MEEEELKNKEPEAAAADAGTAAAPETEPGWLARIRQRFPEREFDGSAENEAEFYEDYDRSMADLNAMREDNRRLVDVLQQNPEFAEVFSRVKDGMPMRVALARVVDFDATRPVEGDPDYEDFMREAGEFKKRQAEIADHRKRIEENQARSRGEIEEFFGKIGADEAEQTGFADFLQGVFDDVFEGNLGKAALGKLWQAYKYDEDMEAAREAGEVQGRNEAIETKRALKKATDGMPDAGAGAAPEAPRRRRIIDTDRWGSR